MSPNSAKIPDERFERDVHGALKLHRGNVTLCSEGLGFDHAPLLEFVRARPQLFSIVLNARESLADRAEDMLLKAFDRKLPWSVDYVNDTLAQNPDLMNIWSTPSDDGADEPFCPRLSIDELVRIDQVKRNEFKKPRNSDPGDLEFMRILDRAGIELFEAIWNNSGSLRAAAKRLGVTRKQLIDYIVRRPGLQAALYDEREKLIDRAETMLGVLVDRGVPWAIKFALRTLGRPRGYSPHRDPRNSPGQMREGRADGRCLSREEIEDLDKLQALGRAKVPATTPGR